MGIQMIDIAKAVNDYHAKLKTQVIITPSQGPTINAGEKFFVSTTIVNGTGIDGVNLINVRFLFFAPEALAGLIVPPSSSGLATDQFITDPPLTPGVEINEFVLFLSHQYYSLSPGQSVTLPDIGVIAKQPTPVGNHDIRCYVIYDFEVLVGPHYDLGSGPLKIF